MNEQTLVEFKRQIEADYKAELAAVNQLLERFRADRVARSRAIAIATTRRKRKSRSLYAEEIIKATTGPFTIPDIDQKVREAIARDEGKALTTWRDGPDYRRIVGQMIHTLKDGEKIIDVVEPGRGSRSGVYQMKQPAK